MDESSASAARHRERQSSFFERKRHLWPGTYLDRFDFAGLHPLSVEDLEKIREAAASVGNLYAKLANKLTKFDEYVLQCFGLPHEALAIVRTREVQHWTPTIGRADLVLADGGYKLLEVNYDCPNLIMEAFSINAAICEDNAVTDPNARDNEVIRDAFRRRIADLGVRGDAALGRVSCAVISRRRYTRDFESASYLAEIIEGPEFTCSAVCVDDVSFDENGLYHGGKRINCAVLMYPILDFCRHSVRRRDSAHPSFMGFADLAALIERSLVFMINDLRSIILHSKVSQVALWNLANVRELFTGEDEGLVRRFLLPTYLDPPDRVSYVRKPVLGSNGDTISVHNSSSCLRANANTRQTYADQLAVYQEYVELPRGVFLTEEGPLELPWVVSCFIVDGTPCGIVLRAGRGITDASWWVVPLCVSAGPHGCRTS